MIRRAGVAQRSCPDGRRLHVIEAADREEAVELAKACPNAESGRVEVREIIPSQAARRGRGKPPPIVRARFDANPSFGTAQGMPPQPRGRRGEHTVPVAEICPHVELDRWRRAVDPSGTRCRSTLPELNLGYQLCRNTGTVELPRCVSDFRRLATGPWCWRLGRQRPAQGHRRYRVAGQRLL